MISKFSHYQFSHRDFQIQPLKEIAANHELLRSHSNEQGKESLQSLPELGGGGVDWFNRVRLGLAIGFA